MPTDLSLIVASVSTILSVVGIISMMSLIMKIKKVLKEHTERQSFQTKKMEGDNDHYYSKADTPAQIEHAQWKQLEQELKSE